MNCEEVRLLLAAYRRSDWSEKEQRAANQHMSQCSDCRRYEVEARSVGERLRQLPTITPPDSLRARVFAAIKEEAISSQPIATGASLHDTNPMGTSMRGAGARVVIATYPRERVGEVALGAYKAKRMLLGKSTAIATIAALFAILFIAKLAPLGGVSRVSVDPNSVLTSINPPDKQLLKIQADATFPTVTSALATDKQVIYVGQSDDGQQALLAYDREANKTEKLVSVTENQTLALKAVTPQMLVWLISSNGLSWSLQATPLVNGMVTSPISLHVTLVTRGDLISGMVADRISGLWVDQSSALLAIAPVTGTALLARIDLSSDGLTTTNTFITQALPGHTLTDPYLDGSTNYWVDTTFGADGAPQGTIWRSTDSDGITAVPGATSAFGPIAKQNYLVWFAQKSASINSDSVASALGPSTGSIVTREKDDGNVTTLSTTTISADSVRRGIGYVLWRDETGEHAYVLGQSHPFDLSLPAVVRSLSLTATSITWVTPSQHSGDPTNTIVVYNLPG